MANTLDKIKLSGVTYDIIDATAVHSLDGYYTSGQTNDAITAATSALAETIGNMHYQTSGDVQNAIAEGVSGKVDTTAYTAYTAATETALGNKADKTEIPAVSGYADSVKYNSTSKYIEFYHGGTGGTKVFEYDASPFLIDGMVQNVEIKSVEISGVATTCLVISFNTDAGKQDINIPLTEIFDASNYYTKAEVDAELSGKTDTATTSALNDVVTAHTANTNIHLDATEKANLDSLATNISTISGITSSNVSTWNGKQDALVSGTNIKTVGGNSLLGSGNIDWPAGLTATVSGTTLIFS